MFIYGSCVSRDTFEHVNAQSCKIVGYVARQSLISAATPPRTPLINPYDLASPFQRKMIEWDAGSRLFRALSEKAAATDVLVWDLVDERLGIHLFNDGTVVTRTPELLGALKSPPYSAPSRESSLVPFGTVDHHRLFASALDTFIRTLSSTGLLHKTVLLAPPWATHTERGNPTPTSFGIKAQEANAMVIPYLATIEARGIPIVTTPLRTTTADEHHRWGLAPFHYSQNVYSNLLASIPRAGEGGSRD